MGAAESETENLKVVVRKVVRADPERVFDAWTDARLMEQWLFCEGGQAKSRNELRVGGTYQHEMILPNGASDCPNGTPQENGYTSYPHHGEYLEIDRPRRLVFTWNSPAVQNTRVTVELNPVDGGTEVVVTHELLQGEAERLSHTEGWHACLASLAGFIER